MGATGYSLIPAGRGSAGLVMGRHEGGEVQQRFWVYVNRVHQYAKVHRADCRFCNDGVGIQARRRDVAGHWLGPFDTAVEVVAAGARAGRQPSACMVCAPPAPDPAAVSSASVPAPAEGAGPPAAAPAERGAAGGTHKQRLLDEIRRRPGQTDRQLRERAGVEPHQQVNTLCRALERDELIERRCGSDGRIVNVPRTPETSMGGGPSAPPAYPMDAPRSSPADDGELAVLPDLDPAATLVVIGCSGDKQRSGDPIAGGATILADLPTDVGVELAAARRRNAERAQINDESGWLSAMRRYTGYFYDAAHAALQRAATHPQLLVILSGGYGLVRSDEPIRYYNARYHASWWPDQVVERALAAYARQLGVRGMVALLPATTHYAEVVRRTDWAGVGLELAVLASPDARGRDGAQRAVPKAAGEAYTAFLHHDLHPGWYSSEGLPLRATRLA